MLMDDEYHITLKLFHTITSKPLYRGLPCMGGGGGERYVIKETKHACVLL